MATAKHPIAPSASSNTDGIAEITSKMCPTMAKATPMHKALKRPVYTSATYAPSNGVI